MAVYLLSVCKKKPVWLTDLQKSYIKKLPRHVTIYEKNINPTTLEKEGEQLLKTTLKYTTNNFKIALSSEGDLPSSELFAQNISNWQEQGKDIVFYIGGADGLSDTLKKQCDWVFSLSRLTFAHMIAHVVFFEQLYRAFSIIDNKPYHWGHR